MTTNSTKELTFTIKSFLPRPSGSPESLPPFEPHSILRHFDDELFSIGDFVTNGTKMRGKILSFSFLNDQVFVETDWSKVGMNLDSLVKIKEEEDISLVLFGNYLLKRYGVMVHSSDGKNQPIYQREVCDADLCNWKDEIQSTTKSPRFTHGDKVKVFLMPEGEDSFPGFTGSILVVHNYVGKIKYDIELRFAGGFSTRVYNIDEVLVSAI